MGFFFGMIIGIAIGIGLIVAFARAERIRSKCRSDLVHYNSNQILLHHVCLLFFLLFFFFVFFVLFCFLVDVLCVILGQDSGSVCKDDSARFKKTSPKPVLSILGRLHATPEVEFYFTNPPTSLFSLLHVLPFECLLYVTCTKCLTFRKFNLLR